MKNLLPVLLLTAVLARAGAPPASAPLPDRDQVLAVVQQFFATLASKDAAAYRALFVPATQVTSARHTPEGFVLRRRTCEEDLQRLQENPSRLLERSWNSTVHVQGRVAVVWTPYDFHIDGRFSHSGIDVFSLVRTDAGWKIASAVYSVEPGTPSQHPAGPP